MLRLEKISKSAIPEATLKPILRLPLKNADIFNGDKNSIYAVGYNETIKRYEIFLFNHNKRLFETIAIYDKKINALSGSGRKFYIVTGRQIMEFSDGIFNFFYEHPREEILELLYSEKIGLFYKTSHGVGFIKDGYAIEFLNSDSTEIFLKGTSLYIFFTKLFGMAEFSGIDDLKRYNFKVEKLIDVKKTF